MKLLSLNTWGGRLFEPLTGFLSQLIGEVDIFCFQEVFSTNEERISTHEYRANLLKELKTLLEGYDFFFVPNIENLDIRGNVSYHLEFGLAIFWRRALDISNKGSIQILDLPRPKDLRREDVPKKLIFITLSSGEKEVTICNFHGYAYPGDKTDTPLRLEQSRKITRFLSTIKGEKILCGDFNLMPETESVRLIEQGGMRDLIKEFKIKDTRGPVNEMLYRGKEDLIQRFADFIFVSGETIVKSFELPEVEISDHLPMVLDFK